MDTVIDSLPASTRARLQQTLAQWRHWRCEPQLDSRPEPVEILHGGISNFSVLVAAREKFVVRIDGMDPETNGLHRHTTPFPWVAPRHASETACDKPR